MSIAIILKGYQPANQRLTESDGFEPSIFVSVSQGELRMEKTAFRRNRVRSSSSRAKIPKGERLSW